MVVERKGEGGRREEYTLDIESYMAGKSLMSHYTKQLIGKCGSGEEESGDGEMM